MKGPERGAVATNGQRRFQLVCAAWDWSFCKVPDTGGCHSTGLDGTTVMDRLPVSCTEDAVEDRMEDREVTRQRLRAFSCRTTHQSMHESGRINQDFSQFSDIPARKSNTTDVAHGLAPRLANASRPNPRYRRSPRFASAREMVPEAPNSLLNISHKEVPRMWIITLEE